MTAGARALGTALLASAAACGGAAPPPATGAAAEHPRAATICAQKCTKCHARPEPGKRSRAELESAFKRHTARVKLDEADWRDMVDYLAARSE
jgi:hypothetical protein